MSRNAWITVCTILLGWVAVALLVSALYQCSGTGRRVAHVTVVSTGAGLAALHARHQAAYTAATDRLREALRGDGGTFADYEREVAPIDAAFRARSIAIAALDADLYAAAAIVDATRAGAGTDVQLAVGRRVLEAIRRTLPVLADGHVLPPVPIPADVRAVVDQLSALVEGPHAVAR